MGDCSTQREPQSRRPYAVWWPCKHGVGLLQNHLWRPSGEIVGQSRFWPLPIDLVLVKSLWISWFPRLRFCGRSRNLEFAITITIRSALMSLSGQVDKDCIGPLLHWYIINYKLMTSTTHTINQSIAIQIQAVRFLWTLQRNWISLNATIVPYIL